MNLLQDIPLPAAIGKPSMRALAGAGVTSLRQVATLSDAELLALHGVGPKAVRILRATLAEIEGKAPEGPSDLSFGRK